MLISFQLTVDPSGVGFDLDVPLQVVIGSIPLASIAQQYGLNIPTTIEPPPAGAPAGLYGDASLPNIRKFCLFFLNMAFQYICSYHGKLVK